MVSDRRDEITTGTASRPREMVWPVGGPGGKTIPPRCPPSRWGGGNRGGGEVRPRACGAPFDFAPSALPLRVLDLPECKNASSYKMEP